MNDEARPSTGLRVEELEWETIPSVVFEGTDTDSERRALLVSCSLSNERYALLILNSEEDEGSFGRWVIADMTRDALLDFMTQTMVLLARSPDEEVAS